jgi:hypothetical protein
LARGEAVFVCLIADPKIENRGSFLDRGKNQLSQQHFTRRVPFKFDCKRRYPK